MPFYAYNKTTSAKAIVATGVTLTVVPPSAISGTRGKAWDVTKALQPNATVDPINGATGGRTAAEYAAIQAALVAVGDVEFQWSGAPEYLTDGLQVISPDIISAPQALSGPGALSVLTRSTLFTSTAAGNALTLANGLYFGQRKTVAYTAEAAGADTGVITPAAPGNFATATLTNKWDSVEFEWSGTVWNVVGFGGAAVVA